MNSSSNFNFKRLLKSKKGDWTSVIFIIVVLFALAITIPVGKLIIDEVTTGFIDLNATTPIASEATDILIENNNRYAAVWDGLFLTILILVFFGTVVSSFFIRSHPLFYIVGMIVQTIFVFLSMIFGEAIDEIYSTGVFPNITANFPIITTIMGNFPFYMFLFCMLVGIALYAKQGGTGGGEV